MLVEKAQPLPSNASYAASSPAPRGRSTAATGPLAGEPLPEGLRESEELPGADLLALHEGGRGTPRREHHFRPDVRHRGNGARDETARHQPRALRRGRDTLRARGIILADTKYEFGAAPTGELILIDEVMTPDSSRFWPADSYRIGGGQPSLDKQPVRDHPAGDRRARGNGTRRRRRRRFRRRSSARPRSAISWPSGASPATNSTGRPHEPGLVRGCPGHAARGDPRPGGGDDPPGAREPRVRGRPFGAGRETDPSRGRSRWAGRRQGLYREDVRNN